MHTFQSFVNGIKEAKQDDVGEQRLAVFTFGRFNPPTQGHQKIINFVEEIARQRGGTPYVFTSVSSDAKKNPLPYETKIRFLRELFPSTNVVVNHEIRNPFQAVGYLSNIGITDIVFVVGSDRVEEFRKRFNRAYEYFDSFEVISAGERDPDATDTAGMSGTKAREAATENDIGKFRAATGWEGEIAEKLMRAVQQGMEK